MIYERESTAHVITVLPQRLGSWGIIYQPHPSLDRTAPPAPSSLTLLVHPVCSLSMWPCQREPLIWESEVLTIICCLLLIWEGWAPKQLLWYITATFPQVDFRELCRTLRFWRNWLEKSQLCLSGDVLLLLLGIPWKWLKFGLSAFKLQLS